MSVGICVYECVSICMYMFGAEEAERHEEKEEGEEGLGNDSLSGRCCTLRNTQKWTAIMTWIRVMTCVQVLPLRPVL